GHEKGRATLRPIRESSRRESGFRPRGNRKRFGPGSGEGPGSSRGFRAGRTVRGESFTLPYAESLGTLSIGMLALSLALPMAALSQPPVVPADGKIAFEISPKSVVVARLPLCAVQNCLLLPTFSEAG